MTKDEIVEFFKAVGAYPTNGEIDDLWVSANDDAHEGAEWLPYYKMSLSLLSECIGILSSQLPRPLTGDDLADHLESARLWHHSLLLSGIGPQRCHETIKLRKERADEGYREFLK